MNIRYETTRGQTTIDVFARKHGLTMRVTEYIDPLPGQARFSASLEDIEIKDGPFLRSIRKAKGGV